MPIGELLKLLSPMFTLKDLVQSVHRSSQAGASLVSTCSQDRSQVVCVCDYECLNCVFSGHNLGLNTEYISGSETSFASNLFLKHKI